MERDRKNRLPWAIVLIILAFSCAIAYAGALIYARSSAGSDFATYTTVHLESARKVQTVSDGFIYYDGSSVTKVNERGGVRWSYVVGANADFDACDAGIACWVGSKLTLIDAESGSPTYSGNLEGAILSAAVGREYAAALLEPEHNGTVVLMEKGGRRVDGIELSDQTVIDYGFFYHDTLFWAMSLDTNGTTPSCTVNTYNPGKRIVGSITDSEQTLYRATFQSSQISCVGDTYIRVYTYNGSEEADRRRLVYGWTLVDTDDHSDAPLMLFTLNGEYETEGAIRDVRLIRDSEEQTIRLPYGCMDVKVWNDGIYGFSRAGYVMIGRMGEQKVDAYQITLTFDTVYGMTGDGTAVLGNGNDVYLLRLTK